jgi:hypothetical protein
VKLTLSAAMRARDVSRPHPEHLADAEKADAEAAKADVAGAEARQARPADGTPARNVRRFKLR